MTMKKTVFLTILSVFASEVAAGYLRPKREWSKHQPAPAPDFVRIPESDMKRMQESPTRSKFFSKIVKEFKKCRKSNDELCLVNEESVNFVEKIFGSGTISK